MPAKKTHNGHNKKNNKRSNKKEAKQADKDVSYTSKIWKRDVTATDVFINPTIDTTGEGIRQLVDIAHEGGTEFIKEYNELNRQVKAADHDYELVSHTNVYDLLDARGGKAGNPKVNQARAALAKTAEEFGKQTDRIETAYKLAHELIFKFDLLEKVAKSLVATKEELGNKVTVDETGRKKVAVSAKCIDALWKDVLTMYAKFKRTQDEVAIVKAWLPPVKDQLKQTLIEGLVDADGNDLGPQVIWCYDPHDVLILASDVNDPDLFSAPSEIDVSDDAIGGLKRIEELVEDEAAVSETIPASGDDSTLVEEFEKVQLTPINPYPLGSSTPPGSPVPSNDKGTHEGEGKTTGTQKQDIKHEDLKSDRKRKARDDSPEGDENADIKDEEVESDSDDLEFICE